MSTYDLSGPNQLLTLPTGAGKTSRARERARTHLQAGGRVLLLVPLRALAAEVARDWQAHLPGHQVQAYVRELETAGGTRPHPYRQADVLIMTPERLDLLTRQWRRHHHWLARLTLVIADELHLLADAQRGAHLDGALSRLRQINPLAELWAMTATCGNPAALSRTLQAELVTDGERPVPLSWQAFTVPSGAHKRDVLLRVLTPGQRTIIFVHSRERTAELAAALSERGFTAHAHHAGLSAEERTQVEDAYRQGAQVLVCTPTLELGVNLGADQVILHDLSLPHPSRPGRWVTIGVNAAWQRAGRAGRQVGSLGRVSVLGTALEDPQRYLPVHGQPPAFV